MVGPLQARTAWRGRQRRPVLFERVVVTGCHQPGQELLLARVGFARRAPAVRFGRDMAALLDAPDQVAHTTHAHPKARRQLRAGAFTAFPCPPDARTQILRICSCHSLASPNARLTQMKIALS